jgi:hypothetical protein
VSIDIAYCKQKLFRDAVLLGRLLELLLQRRALLASTLWEPVVPSKAITASPAPPSLKSLAETSVQVVLWGFRHAYPSFDDSLRSLVQDYYRLVGAMTLAFLSLGWRYRLRFGCESSSSSEISSDLNSSIERRASLMNRPKSRAIWGSLLGPKTTRKIKPIMTISCPPIPNIVQI